MLRCDPYLTNVQISDPTLGLTFTLPTNLAPVTATAPFFTGISWPVGDHTNVVTVAGQSQATGASVSATSSAIAIVVPISISCTLSVSNQFNLDNPIVAGHVTLPSNAPVVVQLSIDNPSADDLDVSISPLTLFDCISGTQITLPPSVFIAAGGSSNFVGCLPVNCPGGTNISVTVQGTAVASKLISCIFDSRGSNIMSAASSCMAQVVCTQGCVCVNPALGLGAAGGTAVLELDAASVSITGPAGGLLGNVSIGPGGKLSITGSEFITGKVILAPGATFTDSSSGSIGGIEMNVDLSSEINAAYAAAVGDAHLPCTQQFTTLDGKTVTRIVGGSGLNVICVGNIVLSGTQILLTGPSDALFIFNVTNKFVLTGGGAGPQIRVDQSAGLKPSAVLYNILGSGPDVAFSGGGGGVNCCAAIVDGTILAPFRKIALSPGLVNGEIISSKDISIVSGSSVRCPCPPSTKAIVNGSNPVLNTQEN